jgi:hypothetical protein
MVIGGVGTDWWRGNSLPPTPSPLYIATPYPLLGAILETLIHISHSDQHTPGGLGLELSNVVD